MATTVYQHIQAIVTCLVTLAPANALQASWLHGTVLDQNNAAMPGIHVIVSGPQKCDVQSGTDGTFNCQLAAGEYDLAAESMNTLPYRRATFYVKPSAHEYVVVRPVFRGPSDIPTTDPKVYYTTYSLSLPLGKREVEIRYRQLMDTPTGGRYLGPNLMLTMDYLSVYADVITCSQPIRTCFGEGRVTVDLGRDRISGTSIVINFVQGEITVTRDPTITRKIL
jgi:hypothetical protein